MASGCTLHQQHTTLLAAAGRSRTCRCIPANSAPSVTLTIIAPPSGAAHFPEFVWPPPNDCVNEQYNLSSDGNLLVLSLQDGVTSQS